MEQKKEAPAAEPEAAGNTSADTVTEPKATIKIEGQGFELDAALAQEDKTSKVDECPQHLFRIGLDHFVEDIQSFEDVICLLVFRREPNDRFPVPAEPVGTLAIVAVEPRITGRVID